MCLCAPPMSSGCSRSLAQAIDAFFDAVMVMDKDARIKINRLTLLKTIDDYLLETADYSKIVLN